jgi:hypothetical protein
MSSLLESIGGADITGYGARALRTVVKRQIDLSLANNARKGLPTLVVLVIDQFEELFTKHLNHWQQRVVFLRMLADSISELPHLRILLSMREEYLASLDPFADLLPDGLQVRFRLSLLNERSALDACAKPAERAGVPFKRSENQDQDAACALVRALRQVPEEAGQVRVAEFVEPLQLQVVCATLWNELPDETREITLDHVAKLGDIAHALEKYYEDTLDVVRKATGTQASRLRRWIEEKLILQDGTRNLVYVDAHADTVAGLPPSIVELLTDLQLLRPEVREGRHWYELSHDRLVSAIRSSNERWRQRIGGPGPLLELSAREYFRQARPASLLLASAALESATQWVSSKDAEQYGVSPELREFLDRSLEWEQKRKERENLRIQQERMNNERQEMRRTRRRIIVVFSGVLALLVLGFFTWSILERKAKTRVFEQESLALTEAARRIHEQGKQSSLGDSQFSELYFAAMAVGVARSQGIPPSRDAMAVLSTASNEIGHGLFLPRSKHASKALFLPSGEVLVVGDAAVTIWDWKKSKKANDYAADPGEIWLDARLVGPDLVIMHSAGSSSDVKTAVRRRSTDQPPDWVNNLSQGEKANCCDVSPDGTTALVYDGNGARTVSTLTGATQVLYPATVDLLQERFTFGKNAALVLLCNELSAVCTVWNRQGDYLYTLDAGRAGHMSERLYAPLYPTFSRDGSFVMLAPQVPARQDVTVATWELKEHEEETRKSRRQWVIRSETTVGFAERQNNGKLEQIVLAVAPDGSAHWMSPQNGAQGEISGPSQKVSLLSRAQLLSFTEERRRLIFHLILRGSEAPGVPAAVSDGDVSEDGSLFVYLRGESYPQVIDTKMRSKLPNELSEDADVFALACSQLINQPEYRAVQDYCGHRP